MLLKHKFIGPVIKKLERNGEVLHIYHTVDPNLEMSHIHLEERRNKNRVIVYHKIKNTSYKAISNLFGDVERTIKFLEPQYSRLKNLANFISNPPLMLKNFRRFLSLLPLSYYALPKRGNIKKVGFKEIKVTDLPLIKHWEMDGGAFITLPQVYSEDPVRKGIWHSNLGMYRIQLNGNEYVENEEVGLHYQLHRGIGIHHTLAKQLKTRFKVSVFVGGHPAHTFSAVMPLPEGMPEICMAGFLSQRRFRYDYLDGWLVSLDADFVILGEVDLEKNKPEGPFGDHLGYYSLVHPFPYMKIYKVLAKPDGIWPFTVVGRPPQEDTIFGHLIHDVTHDALMRELPGISSIYAVDAAGVHPLLLAVGSERYTPYLDDPRPSELITQSLRILGTGQLSLAKFLFIMEKFEGIPHPFETKKFFREFLLRVDEKFSLHFLSNTSIDTLDYSGGELNRGSKLFLTATKSVKRTIKTANKEYIQKKTGLEIIEPLEGIWMLAFEKYENPNKTEIQINELRKKLSKIHDELPVFLVLYDELTNENLWQDFLWITFTRCNPQTDIYGYKEYFENKQWRCEFPLIFDARIKLHHAPVLKENPEILKKVKNYLNP